MVSKRTIAGFAMLVLTGVAIGQRQGERQTIPSVEELLREYLEYAQQTGDVAREVPMLISVYEQVRNRRANRVAVDKTFDRIRNSMWQSLSKHLAAEYRTLRDAKEEVPPSVTKILLFTMPCLAVEGGLGDIRRDDLLGRDEYQALADELIRDAKGTDQGLLGHLYKLHEGDREVRIRHALILAQRKPAADVIEHLMEGLHDPDPRIVQETITVLGMIGPPAETAIPALEKLAEREEKQLSERAKAALRQIRGK